MKVFLKTYFFQIFGDFRIDFSKIGGFIPFGSSFWAFGAPSQRWHPGQPPWLPAPKAATVCDISINLCVCVFDMPIILHDRPSVRWHDPRPSAGRPRRI